MGARRWKLSRFAELLELLQRADVVASPLGAGEFSFEATSVGLERLTVLTGGNSPLLLQASVPADTACVVLSLAGRDCMRVNGQDMRPGLITIHGAGAMHMSASHSRAAWAAIALNTDELEHLLPPRPGRLGQSGASATVLAGANAWERAAALFRAVDEVARSEPEVFEVDEARRALRAQLRDTLFELLQRPPRGSQAHLLRRPDGSERVIRLVDEYLRANTGRAITGAELARAVDSSEPRLRAAFRAMFGVGLSRYLVVRQLFSLHAAVSGGADNLVARRSLATTHGFWNLETLEREYQALFREPFLSAGGRVQSVHPVVDG